MTERYTSAALAVLLAWVFWGVATLFMPTWAAMAVGAALGGLAVRYLRDNVVLRGIVAVLDPIAVVLPLLILRQAIGALGLPFLPFGTWELLGFLVLYVAFLATGFGVLPVDLYRYGYRPLPVAAVVLGLCGYAALTGHWFIALAAVTGQALWVSKIGSSNYFDHILHAVLVPVVIVVLIARMFG